MDVAVYTGKADVRAGILVTGTEVLTGIITDRNGPWLSERLRELGVDVEGILVVGDRPDDVLAGLRWFESEGVQVVVTSGGLGPTADDLTAEIVGRFRGREMVLDPELEQSINAILNRLRGRFRNVDPEALAAANRKQAVIPEGAAVLAPVGTAPGLVVPPAEGMGGPVVVVLPGPPSELKPMWSVAVQTEAFGEAIAGAPVLRREMLRMFGIPEAEIAVTLRAAAEAGIDLSELEITTCLRRGEIEVSTRFSPDGADAYAALKQFLLERHGDDVFSPDGATIDAMVASALVAGGWTVATAESCTGGMLAGRLTDLPGSSAYVLGGLVTYSNEAKSAVADVPAATIASVGAVSAEVAEALADGARARLGSTFAVGITGIAGPGGGTEEKPVGTVWFAVTSADGRKLVRHTLMPGDRAAIRERSTTVAMHLLARIIAGDGEPR
jgi:nicotinamide-nucleotide amidase